MMIVQAGVLMAIMLCMQTEFGQAVGPDGIVHSLMIELNLSIIARLSS